MESKLHSTYFKDWKTGVVTARKFLEGSGKPQKILIEQNRNLGDTLHLIPVIRHYRRKFPEAAIAFVIGKAYANAHAYNPDVDKIFMIPTYGPKERIQLRREIIKYDHLDHIIAPSIFPYASIWKELVWSYPNIADQYLANSGIKDRKPLGGRRLRVFYDESDKKWAQDFWKKHKLTRKKTVALEYYSYSGQPTWTQPKIKAMTIRLKHHKIRCISFAGKNEKALPGTIDATGTSWRRTVALLEMCGAFCGVGSGLTMLAAACEKQPAILELNVSHSITMKGCGYADSIKIGNPDPVIVADHIRYKVLY